MSILFGQTQTTMQLSRLLRKLDKRRVRLLFSRHDDSYIDHINGQFQPFCSGGALRIWGFDGELPHRSKIDYYSDAR